MILLFLFITFALQTMSIPGYYNMPVYYRVPVQRVTVKDCYPPWGKTHRRRWKTCPPHKTHRSHRGHS